MRANYEHFKPVFEAVLYTTMSEGGDGDGAILSKYVDYKETADLFERFLKEKTITHLERMDMIDCVLFSDKSNENILVSKPEFRNQLPPWMTIIIEL